VTVNETVSLRENGLFGEIGRVRTIESYEAYAKSQISDSREDRASARIRVIRQTLRDYSVRIGREDQRLRNFDESR